jgi:predicted DNA-binding transcriptional regulator AlpA
MSPKTYSIDQFTHAFNISRATLYRAWERNEGPAKIQVGRRVLIPVDAAEEWLKSLHQQAASA